MAASSGTVSANAALAANSRAISQAYNFMDSSLVVVEIRLMGLLQVRVMLPRLSVGPDLSGQVRMNSHLQNLPLSAGWHMGLLVDGLGIFAGDAGVFTPSCAD